MRLALTLVLSFSAACSSNSLEHRVSELEAKVATQEIQQIISSETATLIAKGYIFLDYDLKGYDVSAEQFPESWKIQFKMKCIECNGGNPYVLVNNRTGEVIQVFNAK